mmetsp:Transcript_42040/g.119360  ORF Transcript_42040/g.119360 Transcript_42040/m.119360 type:complete len:346 (+) Transcript_42040:1407-2444(+)
MAADATPRDTAWPSRHGRDSKGKSASDAEGKRTTGPRRESAPDWSLLTALTKDWAASFHDAAGRGPLAARSGMTLSQMSRMLSPMESVTSSSAAPDDASCGRLNASSVRQHMPASTGRTVSGELRWSLTTARRACRPVKQEGPPSIQPSTFLAASRQASQSPAGAASGANEGGRPAGAAAGALLSGGLWAVFLGAGDGGDGTPVKRNEAPRRRLCSKSRNKVPSCSSSAIRSCRHCLLSSGSLALSWWCLWISSVRCKPALLSSCIFRYLCKQLSRTPGSLPCTLTHTNAPSIFALLPASLPSSGAALRDRAAAGLGRFALGAAAGGLAFGPFLWQSSRLTPALR